MPHLVNNTQPYTITPCPASGSPKIHLTSALPVGHYHSASSVLGAKDGTSGSGGAMYLSPHGAWRAVVKVGVEAIFCDFGIDLCI